MADSISILSDDHLDLIVTAALDWRILVTRTMAAFASPLEQRLVASAADEAGRLIREENLAAVAVQAELGRGRLADRLAVTGYGHRRVDQLVPVEVIKAVQAARAACGKSPTWSDSSACQLLEAVSTAATYRLPGYASAPWWWTRPQLRSGQPVGVTLDLDAVPEVPGLLWVTPESVADFWEQAPVVVVLVSAASAVPAELPSRAGVFVLLVEDDAASPEVWDALQALDMPALALIWPVCRSWLLEQLADPAVEFSQFRG